MATHTHGWVLFAGIFLLSTPLLSSQVFVVGEKSATSEIATSFKPTNLPLPTDKLGERGRRELIRNLEAEQGFAHLALPVGVLSLRANGDLSPSGDKYRQLIYQNGQAAGPGDRVMVTALTIKGDELVIDLNGGPYAKHRFLSHIQFNDNPVVSNTGERPMGSRISLVFPGGIPDISAPEVKALLAPVVDFGVKSGEQAYADTLPPRLRDAVAAHEVLVGMNHRMVLASLGAPEKKVREESGDANGAVYEEWIYGHVPQTVKFIRFKGDRVAVVEIAELGKPLQIHDKNELQEAEMPANTRVIAMGDRAPGNDGEESAAPAPPSLRLPGEAAPANAQGKVQYPTDKDASRQASRQPLPAAPGSPADPRSQAPPPSVQTTPPSRPQDIGRQAPSLGSQP